MTPAGTAPKRSASGFDEIAWIDAHGDLRIGQVADLPPTLPFEQNFPIRLGAQYQNRHNRHVLHYWAPQGDYVWCESNFEAQCLSFLEQRGLVAAVSSQSFRILFRNDVGPTYHDPDFFTRCHDGSIVVVDVKPERFYTGQVELQFRETRRVCAALGWRHVVMDHLSPALVRNLAVLRSARLPRVHPDEDRLEHLLSVFENGRSIADGRQMIDRRHPTLAMPHILHAIWHRHLKADLSMPLDLDTPLVSREEAPCCR